MQSLVAVLVALQNQAAGKRAAALAVLATTKERSPFTWQIPIWIALLMLALVAAISHRTPLFVTPYLVVPLIIGIGWLAAVVLRTQRRLEAAIYLLSQDLGR
jgi:peptidoglycan/LPS O-acetylase OafA/YrhL